MRYRQIRQSICNNYIRTNFAKKSYFWCLAISTTEPTRLTTVHDAAGAVPARIVHGQPQSHGESMNRLMAFGTIS